MADTLEPVATLCLVWIVERPIGHTPRRSNDFLLFGAKCYLRLDFSTHPDLEDQQYWIALTREAETEASEKPYYVTTFVIDEELIHSHSCVNPCVDIAPVDSEKETLIWYYTPKIVSKYFKSEHGLWRVTCIFNGVALSAFQSEVKTIHLSSADKCVQASVEPPPDLEQLSDDYSNLLESKIYPDVHCADQIRPAHRSILAARSEVFSAMFRNMQVTETDYVDVKDLEESVLDMLLKYVYSGNIPDLCDDTATSLFEAGDKYAVHSLRNACSDWMIGNITEENAVRFLTVADAHRDVEFKNAVVDFINSKPTIFLSDMWSVFSEEKCRLANEVMKGYIALITK